MSLSVDTSTKSVDQFTQDSHGSTPWDPVGGGRRASLETASAEAPKNLSPLGRWDSGTQSTSQVDDLGDGKRLEDQQRTRQREGRPGSDSPHESISHEVAKTGAKFLDIHNDNGDVGRSSATSLDGISLTDRSGDLQRLGDDIRGVICQTGSTDSREFFPIDDLEEVVTRDRVREVLAHHGDTEIETVIGEIFDTKTVSGNTTRRFKIFVNLVLLEKPQLIVEFIKEGLFDLHLPLEKVQVAGAPKGRFHLVRKPRSQDEKPSDPISFFENWSQAEIASFLNTQHELCVPIFDLTTDEDPTTKLSHYKLHKQAVLPFIEDDQDNQGAGGSADVWKVKLHAAHHNLCKPTGSGSNPYFAVKRIRDSDEKADETFRKEVSALNRFSKNDHPHLIKLLCTYHWRNHYYFLFPWADGNLESFWKTYSDPDERLGDRAMAVWLSEQLLGLVKAIQDIHTGIPDVPSTAARKGHLRANAARRDHGKHGDIKPENILFFILNRNSNLPRDAHFKISDFGLAEYHSTRSLHVEANKVGNTPTYRAPELDIMKDSTPKYDIWSLGCVLLEFVVWYLCGWDEVEKFVDARLSEEGGFNYGYHCKFEKDVFYRHVSLDVKGRGGETPTVGAMPKECVTQRFTMLLNHAHCSAFIHDLLRFIQRRLLRMNPQNRAGCDEIVAKFEELHNLCREDPDYCVGRVKGPPERSRTDSSLLVDAELTPEQSEKLMASLGMHGGGAPQRFQLAATATFTYSSVTNLQLHAEVQSRPESLVSVQSLPLARATEWLAPLLQDSSSSKIGGDKPSADSAEQKVREPADGSPAADGSLGHPIPPSSQDAHPDYDDRTPENRAAGSDEQVPTKSIQETAALVVPRSDSRERAPSTMSGSTHLPHGEDGVSSGETDAPPDPPHNLKAQEEDHIDLRTRGVLLTALRVISCGQFKRPRRRGKKAAPSSLSGEK